MYSKLTVFLHPVDQTEMFLNCLSRRLSSRSDCAKTEYLITITPSFIQMEPIVHVFPDTYHRHIYDKVDIISFILKSKNISSSNLSSGTYKYVLSQDKKRRRWVRLK